MKKQPLTYYQVKGSKKRTIVNQGGTRSGKTYSILKALIELCAINRNARLEIDVVRKTLPALRATAMKDFFSILMDEGVYDERLHNKSEYTYDLFGNTWHFYSIDNAQKVRGRARDIAFLNEVNELRWEDWVQMNLRTRHRMICDFNPSMFQHFIYEKVIPDEDTDFFKTTYKDNPFLSEAQVKEIEKLRYIDPDYWKVYGLGERGVPREIIYTYKTFTGTFYEDMVKGKVNGMRKLGYGLDFGYTNDPTAVVEVWIQTTKDETSLFVKQVIYQTGLNISDLAGMMKSKGITSNDVVVCDSAEPRSIADLRGRGFQAIPVRKGVDSIKNGIDTIKQYPLHLYEGDVELIKEANNYKWLTDANEEPINKPVDAFNHGMDAMRYCVNQLTKVSTGKYVYG